MEDALGYRVEESRREMARHIEKLYCDQKSWMPENCFEKLLFQAEAYQQLSCPVHFAKFSPCLNAEREFQRDFIESLLWGHRCPDAKYFQRKF